MPSTIMTISIPESLRNYVEYKVDAAGYGSVSEYIRELIRADRSSEMEQWRSSELRRKAQEQSNVLNSV